MEILKQEGLILEESRDQKGTGDQAKEHEKDQAKDHAEAVAFVEKHRGLFENYARGGVKFAPAPEGLDTFAFDLNSNTIYINSKFYESMGLSDEKTSFATLHEIEHFLEKKTMLSEIGGEKEFGKYVERIGKSKAFGLMDNCVADIRENSAVVGKTHGSFGEIERNCYKEDLFKETDFTKDPRHIQFSYALLREARVPDEICKVAPEVREKIDGLKAVKAKDGTRLFDIMTNPSTPMSTRLRLQDKFVWPIVEDLMDKDMEDEKNKTGQSEGKEGNKEKDGDGQKGPKGKAKEPGSNEVFAGAYERAAQKVPNAVPLDAVKKAFEEWKKVSGGDPLKKAENAYAEKLGVKRGDLEKYRKIVESLNAIKNPETNESVIEELRALILKIIAKRRKPAMKPRYPVEEGEDLADPAQLVADVKAGNLEPKVWETDEVKERPDKKFGEIEITLVCDRSSSMGKDGGAKKIEQQKAAILMMEALKEFADLCGEEQVNMDKPLEVRSEVYSFQSDENDDTPLKKMSKELGEKDRIEISARLGSAPGTTTDFVPLEAIVRGIDEELREKILEGKVKKIVIVFTDGGSDDVSRVEAALKNLRKAGVVAIGVGITESGKPALTTYAPNARLAETAESLPNVLGDLLKEHLADV